MEIWNTTLQLSYFYHNFRIPNQHRTCWKKNPYIIFQSTLCNICTGQLCNMCDLHWTRWFVAIMAIEKGDVVFVNWFSINLTRLNGLREKFHNPPCCSLIIISSHFLIIIIILKYEWEDDKLYFCREKNLVLFLNNNLFSNS